MIKATFYYTSEMTIQWSMTLGKGDSLATSIFTIAATAPHGYLQLFGMVVDSVTAVRDGLGLGHLQLFGQHFRDELGSLQCGKQIQIVQQRLFRLGHQSDIFQVHQPILALDDLYERRRRADSSNRPRPRSRFLWKIMYDHGFCGYI